MQLTANELPLVSWRARSILPKGCNISPWYGTPVCVASLVGAAHWESHLPGSWAYLFASASTFGIWLLARGLLLSACGLWPATRGLWLLECGFSPTHTRHGTCGGTCGGICGGTSGSPLGHLWRHLWSHFWGLPRRRLWRHLWRHLAAPVAASLAAREVASVAAPTAATWGIPRTSKQLP